jgi:hypothetical protein
MRHTVRLRTTVFDFWAKRGGCCIEVLVRLIEFIGIIRLAGVAFDVHGNLL